MSYNNPKYEPVSSFIDNSKKVQLNPNSCSGIKLYLQFNQVGVQFSSILSWMRNSTNFIQVQDFQLNSGCEGSYLGAVQFVGDIHYTKLDATLYSITDMLVQIGGLFNTLHAVGFIICAVFSYRLFYTSLI